MLRVTVITEEGEKTLKTEKKAEAKGAYNMAIALGLEAEVVSTKTVDVNAEPKKRSS